MTFKAGKITHSYHMLIDLGTCPTINDAIKFETEEHYDEVVESMRKFNNSEIKCDVGIRNADGSVEEISFETFRARLFKK